MDSLTQPFPYTSRLAIDPATHLPEIDSFSGLSDFLRRAIADEESRNFSESMTVLAAQAEAVASVLRTDRHRDRAAPVLMDMLTVLRQHRHMMVDLGVTWRGLYEYAAYLQALNNFRVLIGQWLQPEPWDDAVRVTAEDFTLVAWRTLGEGMLLIDMYEQWLEREEDEAGSALGQLEEPQVQRVMQWWHKLRR
jgi:hypothetical protein